MIQFFSVARGSMSQKPAKMDTPAITNKNGPMTLPSIAVLPARSTKVTPQPRTEDEGHQERAAAISEAERSLTNEENRARDGENHQHARNTRCAGAIAERDP